MSLQFRTPIQPNGRGALVYIPVDVVTDSKFPFDPGQDVAFRVAGEAAVATPLDCSIETLELPDLDPGLLDPRERRQGSD